MRLRREKVQADGQVFFDGGIVFSEVRSMERGKRIAPLDGLAELFDLPADLVAGQVHLEMVGDRQLYVEHHQGILSYSGLCIDVNTAQGILRVEGERLELLAMTAGELRIGGCIRCVGWVV